MVNKRLGAERYFYSLAALSLFAVFLSIYRLLASHSDRYWFLIWNLVLAWLPLTFAWLLYKKTPKGLVWSWQNFSLFALWLLFLPNAFYLISDFIHLHDTGEINLMYDVILFATYAWCGFLLGFTSLYLVHTKAIKRFRQKAHWLVVVSLLLCGFAIYLGRYLRWNSWDVITNPFGLLFDVTDRIVNPADHILTFYATLLFFAFLAMIYFVMYNAIEAVKTKPKG